MGRTPNSSLVPPAGRDGAFADIAPPLSPEEARAEAARCLFCHDAPCVRACPTRIDVPSFIRSIATGNLKGAARTIFASNILGGSCARACPVEVLCEGACVYTHEEARPVAIALLQRFATDAAMESGSRFFRAGEPNGRKVAVIGAGPAGLACAHELRLLGYGVTIYESREKPGGLNTLGIASYKMRQEVSLEEARLVEEMGAAFRYGVEVGRDVTVEGLLRRHDAVFFGIGLGETEALGIPGEDLAGVAGAIAFIEEVKESERRDPPFSGVAVGRAVVVIGGGNTAIDAATAAKRLGADRVTIAYRRSLAEMPAFHYEIEIAKKDGVVFEFQAAPLRILGNGKVEGIEFQRTRLGPPDASGRRRAEAVPGEAFALPADRVIRSIGQRKLLDFLAKIPGLKAREGCVVVDPETGATSVPGLFAGGDCVNGGLEVVNAVAEGKTAARGIHAFCEGRARKKGA